MAMLDAPARARFRPRADPATWRRALAGGRIEVCALGLHTTAPDFGFRDRVLDEHVLNFILDGVMTVTAAGGSRALPPGSALWVAPGLPHDFGLGEAGRPFTMINTRWRLRLGRQAVALPEGLLVAYNAWDLRPLFDLLLDDRQRARPDREERMRHVLALLHTDLSGRDGRGVRRPAGLDRGQRLRLAAAVQARPEARLSTAALARLVGMGEERFRRVFRRGFGCAPRVWLVRERIRLAAQCLADDATRPIGAVAAAFGYPDVFLFSRQFRAVMGESPTSWRRRLTGP